MKDVDQVAKEGGQRDRVKKIGVELVVNKMYGSTVCRYLVICFPVFQGHLVLQVLIECLRCDCTGMFNVTINE